MFKPKNIKCPSVTFFNILVPKLGQSVIDKKTGKTYSPPKWIVSLAILFMQIWLILPFILAHFFIDDYINNFLLSVFMGYLLLLIVDYVLACILLKEDNDTSEDKDK